MKIIAWGLLALVLFMVPSRAAESTYNSGQRRVALVIGVGAYSKPSLALVERAERLPV